MAGYRLNRERKLRTLQGFTLIEMMVTVAVLSIAMIIAVPSFTSLINSNRLSGQANELIAAFILARTEAIKQNQFIVLCHSSDAQTCSSAPESGWQGWLVARQVILDDQPTTILSSGTIDTSHLKLLGSPAISSASDVVRFSPQGLARTATNGAFNAILRVCVPSVDDNIRDVELRSGGRARIAKGSNSSCPAPANPA